MYERERAVATAAVLKACRVARKVQSEISNSDSVNKADKSPVTVADYAAQALISRIIFAHFPHYQLIGEEDSQDLRSDAQSNLRSKIVSLANEALASSSNDGDEWSTVGQKEQSTDTWLEAIDRGDAKQTKEGLVWALDPIDGTKGFLRQGQYAVCLALLSKGEPVLGVMGCPNLAVDLNTATSDQGVLFIATKGEGAFQRSFNDPTLKPISMSDVSDLSQASFCESVEAGHSDQSTNAKIASLLKITKLPVRMDSQAKYCSIARGDGDIYLRLPVRADYEEKIWDHASGALLVHEAGGKVTDCDGKPLDFSLGRTLKANKGIVAAHKNIHSEVIDAVRQARS